MFDIVICTCASFWSIVRGEQEQKSLKVSTDIIKVMRICNGFEIDIKQKKKKKTK